MANQKVTELTANVAPLRTDLLLMTDDPSGTPVSMKMTILSLLKAIFVYRAVASIDDTATTNDLFIDVTTGGTNRTVTLPTVASAGAGFVLIIAKEDAGVGQIVIEGAGAETVNGAANVNVVAQFDAAILICTGTAWRLARLLAT